MALKPSWKRDAVFQGARIVGWMTVVATASIGATLKAEPKKWHDALVAETLEWIQGNAWWLLVAAAIVAAVAKGVCVLSGPQWAWKSIHKFLDDLREESFDVNAEEDAVHDHRATLFRHTRWAWWIWPFRHYCWYFCWPWGLWRVPWSGWVVPVCRSGHTTQKTSVIYLAPDDADNGEGVAGQAWARNVVVLVTNLPELRKDSPESDISEYARRTFVSADWIRTRVQAGKPLPRSLCGIPVEVENAIWGVIVLDSKRPDGIKHRSHNWPTTLRIIPKALQEFLKQT